MISRIALSGKDTFPNPLVNKKLYLDICWLRLDFETFTTQGPAATEETAGDLCVDTFTVTASVSTSSVPIICGDNTGQHSKYLQINFN